MEATLGPAIEADVRATTVVDLLRQRVQERPEHRVYTFLDEKETEHTLNFEQLDRRARAIGAQLQAMGAAGQRVVLLYPPGLEYYTGFCGVQYAGAVAVTVSPPRPNQSLAGLQAIIKDAQTR